jgi:hypothetical protein
VARDDRGRWLPGETANPARNGGRPKWPEDLQKVAKLSPEIVERMIAKYVAMPVEEFTAFVQERKGTMLEIMIASVIHKGVLKGEPAYLDFLFNRTIGKMKDDPTSDAASADAAKLAEALPVDTVVAYLRDRKRA